MVMWNQSNRVFSLRVQVQWQLAHVVAAVGQKRHLLIGLHPLRLQHLE